MIRITWHALAHWLGRCGMRRFSTGNVNWDKEVIEAVLLGSRMGTREEARSLAMFVSSSKTSNGAATFIVNPEEVLVSDANAVMFLIRFQGSKAFVCTAAPVAMVMRHVRGLAPKRLVSKVPKFQKRVYRRHKGEEVEVGAA